MKRIIRSAKGAVEGSPIETAVLFLLGVMFGVFVVSRLVALGDCPLGTTPILDALGRVVCVKEIKG